MGTGYYSYEQMAAFVADLQRRVAQLEAENSGLRQQLDGLRRGVGVSVNILGQALPVAAPSYPASPLASPSAPDGMQQREAAAWGTYRHAARHTPQPAAPAPQPQPQPRPQHPFPEDAWLSGAGPAVRQGREERPVSPRRQREQEGTPRPSEWATPRWNREGAAPSGDYASTSVPRPAHHSPDERAWDDDYAPAAAGRRRAYQGNDSSWLG